MNFGSDNQSGASPRVLAALAAANEGYAHSYGDDPCTRRAEQMLKDVFERDLDVFFVATGTAANSLALASLIQPWQCVLCHAHSHIANDESTAPEFFTGGSRLIGLAHREGKLQARHVHDFFALASNDIPHSPRPGALSLTQMSEDGLVYSPDELGQLCAVARERGMKIHMDGARFANAVAALDRSPAELSWKTGVDVLCLGATKNGAFGAEAIVCFDRTLAQSLLHRRKRAGHLLSKSRFAAAQFVGWLEDDHWLALARHANARARQLAAGLAAIPGVRFPWPSNGNELFVIMPLSIANRLRNHGAEFYPWLLQTLPSATQISASETYIRLVTSFQTTEAEVERFCEIARTQS